MRQVTFSFLNAQLVSVVLSFSVDKQCGKVVCSISEYCSIFNEQCEQCSNICDPKTHNYDEKHCTSYCRDYMLNDDLEREIRDVRRNQTISLILLTLLLIMMAVSFGFRITKWILNRRGIPLCFSNSTKKGKEVVNTGPVATKNVKEGSQIFSMSGVDGSVIQTVSTPVSTRYPAENSTTEYSYDNAGLQLSTVGILPNDPETKF